ncbi:helix-turn-helix domain-containing protein [Tsukamurella strandjordii]|uniref:helix-turn-helix domain-containing protein n=1 Tax=Tsukamurella TaxID=2060 RepID=UPI001C7D99AF|nr:helix-turn-helix domain-containing protein [Tsukamurella sp. TY48]GIZ96015.1 PucR family transcriptional regulator [Tsukamurella sp. TY48]
MRLGELIDIPEFRLRLLVDPGEARAVELGRVFTTDQPVPERYLSGGELVLTGLLFHSGDAAESEQFVRSVAAGGAVAIGAGMDHFGAVPDHFVDACSRAGMALFAVPADVSFGDLTHAFIHAAQRQAEQVHAALDRSRKLLAALAEGRALDEIAASVVAATGIGCQLLTAAGKRVAAVGLATTDAQLDEIAAAAQSARSFPLAVSGGTLVPVGSRRTLATAWYLFLGAAPAAIPRDAWDAYDEFIAITSLVRARESDVARLADADGDAAVAALVAGDGRLGAGTVVVVRGGDPRLLRGLVRDALVALAGVTVGVDEGDVIAHLPGGAVGSACDELRRHLLRVAPALDGPVRIGVSDPSPAEGVGGAVRAARLAADLGDGPVSLHTAAELSSARALFAYVPDRVREDFVARVLGPLIDHDERSGSDLLATLRVFLATGGSWVRTADELHLHPNSVRYRIAKAAELTGRDVSDNRARVDVSLALELL